MRSPTKKRLFRWLFLTALLCSLAGGLFASEAEKDLPKIPSFSYNFQPWAVNLGTRIATLRANIPTVNQVVIVPDEATFLVAIADWSKTGRWPILIGDNYYTEMFLARFQPAKVIHLPPVKLDTPLKESMVSAVAAAWDAADVISVQETWQSLGWQPPGIVMTSEKDPAWPAAVALAADRGQPLVFLEGDFGTANQTLTPQQWQQLQQQVEHLVQLTGYSYNKLGDTIDTVTIVRQQGVKYPSPEKEKELRAVTDGLARHENGSRWGIVGWIYGDANRSVYQAMCSIFLDSQTALFYNSYQQEDSWKNYQMNTPAQELTQGGFAVKLVQRPEAGLKTWRSLSEQAWEYDWIFVNSRGSPTEFEVGDGTANVADIPQLKTPAAVYFIHSFSAATPNDSATIAGKWLENGAYAYVGSVDEPFLAAFIPPELLVRRLIFGAPFLVSARQLDSASWKLTTIGDPLMIMTKPHKRISP
ncbi:MAG: hypothetical protein DSM107014_01090 [Gomphosphaeria aponina SAG 52.96 = DSM 107014]|uniref:Uncharacterized protein n=1 Tax=Gomphosphaeria aponina SAG 52.96 = DSM 107014 TaxID=1521640 RepID=A0A941JS94_9CHRO|nr:hypothetical protein [Gomphosphaeria aponina SAG 52.96 = DSM 107014]